MEFLKDLSIDNIRNAAEDAFNQAKPKSEMESKVLEVLSHKNWGASSTLMNEISTDTYDYDKFRTISRLMWESMENQRPAAWRVVFKGLTLLEHLVKNGSERCVDDARNHSHILRGLHQFNYYEGTVDRGLGVREKSKQLVELLGDDERIREERQKARKLREKFGGMSSTASGGGTGYAGYGNDSGWSGSGSGSGGYGGNEGSIRAGSGGGGGYGGDSGGGYSGRYSDDSQTRSTSVAASATPTFAALPDEGSKKKKKTKKKKKVEEEAPAPAPAPAPAAPAEDLFSFDNPTPAAPAPVETGGSADFEAFQSAPAPAASASGNAQFDAFGDFSSANAAPTQQNVQFDAFGGIQQPPIMGGAGGSMNSSGNMAQMNNAFGAMSMQGQQQGGGMMMNNFGMNGGGMQQPMNPGVMGGNTASAVNDNDEFGDFEDAKPAKAPAPSDASDPMARLISLDGLEKNKKKEENKMNAPIISSPAAANFVQNQKTIQSQTRNSQMSFAGIDGLNKPTTFTMPSSNGAGGMGGTGQPVMGGANVTAGGADAIATMMGPPAMMQQQQQQQPQGMQQGGNAMMGMGMQQGGMAMNPQMMMNQQRMMNPNMGGMQPNGMGGGSNMQMNPQMMMANQQQMGGMAMPQQQGMMNQGMGGGMQGMMNAGMQGMTNPMQMGMGGQMGMQQQGMGMGMGGGQMGNQGGGNMMGGQPMGGWR